MVFLANICVPRVSLGDTLIWTSSIVCRRYDAGLYILLLHRVVIFFLLMTAIIVLFYSLSWYDLFFYLLIVLKKTFCTFSIIADYYFRCESHITVAYSNISLMCVVHILVSSDLFLVSITCMIILLVKTIILLICLVYYWMNHIWGCLNHVLLLPLGSQYIAGKVIDVLMFIITVSIVQARIFRLTYMHLVKFSPSR